MSTHHTAEHAHGHTPTREPEPEHRPVDPRQPGHSWGGGPAQPTEPVVHHHPTVPRGEDPAPAPAPEPAPEPAPTPGDDGEAGGEPKQGLFAGLAQKAGESFKDKVGTKVGEKAGDWTNEKLFGKDGEGAGGEGGGAAGGEGSGDGGGAAGGEAGGGVGGEGGPSTGLDSLGDGGTGAAGAAAGGGVGAVAGGVVGAAGGPYMSGGPYQGPSIPQVSMSSGSNAYAWAQASPPAPMAPIAEATHPSRGGLGGMLDEAVQYALEKSGLMDELEKVTGDLAQLNAAAQEWQARAKDAQLVSEQLRVGAQQLAGQWEGAASDSFGRHMGEVVEALDSTADGMLQTAQIIGQCAQECAMAEGMVIEIISEAIEALIASLAAEAVIAVFTAGIGVIADALLTEGEIAVYVARVARVSTKLAETLEKLLKALKELGSAVKAVRNVETAKKALGDLKKVKAAAQELRDFEKAGDGLGKLGKDAFKNRSLSGVGDGLKDYAVRKGVSIADGKLTGLAQDGVKDALGIGSDDPVQTGDLSFKGLGGAAGKSAWGAAQAGLTSDTNKSAVEGELAHDMGVETEPAPYRVDTSRIEQAFG
ncbi:hypothetical protein [Kitasatospora sp. MAP5-34]|uniref:WXG100 family type VII secretion target n=1 Tax=Kitasatospora sp. MAP5-34 TaxID=3035102 RepID=UPI0024762C0C|nr:hypothetical protein [Kitasatospora sp. MAP5-34]MDH6577979.1 uncharacterized protein Yka (UPF0111/DUF47 family) [Kitasatospora sp. MAP5-34]